MAIGRFQPPEDRRGGTAQAVMLALQGLRRFREQQSQAFPGRPTTLGAPPPALSQALGAPGQAPGAPGRVVMPQRAAPIMPTAAPVVAPQRAAPIMPTGPAAPRPAMPSPMAPFVHRGEIDDMSFLNFLQFLARNLELGGGGQDVGAAAGRGEFGGMAGGGSMGGFA